MSIICQGPVLRNPETFSSIEDLRRELHRLNGVVMQQFSTIAHLNQSGHQATMALETILRAYLGEGAEAASAHLESYLFRYPRLREHLEDQIESQRRRRMH
ncbi:hypothetical protein [Caballeronia sp. LZ001]|uniref:hypothetical protein n=1 Tax=Caballeronia sp. LZ001 TaxID=3038553 RepID=UPI002865AF36|nr:hypothetical protein [Caballeronia sp. LZ001]MDR5803426.1 hypothetical protein [Caballeronia sp. LZ001]